MNVYFRTIQLHQDNVQRDLTGTYKNSFESAYMGDISTYLFPARISDLNA